MASTSTLAMESQPEVQTVEQIALSNPLILTQILKHAEIPLKSCRLVSQFWNEMVLSLPNTRLALALDLDPNPHEKLKRSKIPFSELCSSLVDARLVKSIICLAWTRTDSFVPKLIQLCDKFGDTVEILELSIAHETSLQSVYQVLKNSCPNLKQLRICGSYFQSSTDLIPAGEIMPVKQKLTFFKVTSTRISALLTSFIDVVINASPNLKGVTLQFGFCPNLSNSKCLESLTIALDDVGSYGIAQANDKLSDLIRNLDQVSDQLVKLKLRQVNNAGPTNLDKTTNFEKTQFRLPKMLKLQTFCNDMTDIFRCDDLLPNVVPNLKSLAIGKAFEKGKCLDEILQNICPSKKTLTNPNLKNLEIGEFHDPKLLKRLVTAFPNVEELKMYAFNKTDSRGMKSGMELGAVLKACGDWKALKHLELRLPKYPEPFGDIIKAILKEKELFNQLKTLILVTFNFCREPYDLSEDEMDLFKQLLIAMGGMDRVNITELCFTKESAESIHAFMALNEMPVYKFSVVEVVPEETEMTGMKTATRMTNNCKIMT
ncbi:uncharacterized protein LOC110861110 [Folsomia candida]|uniref:uncharacterized protein LOC110861110 n=1 Tax=Folsomia candida TaxID=158441 RepID=UPI0016052915|nr:uncharacterized protein LOC110861110 [Folsomia candida]XP_035716804.1 uncharacterized protein LOC110861110 [Folsomia candida]